MSDRITEEAEDLMQDVVDMLRSFYEAVALVTIKTDGLKAAISGVAGYEPKIQMPVGLIEGLGELAQRIKDKHCLSPVSAPEMLSCSWNKDTEFGIH